MSMAKKKKDKNLSVMLEITGELFNKISKATEPHFNKFKTIAQELLNCSEFIILKHKDNPTINRNYKILKKIEEGEFKKCKAGFEVETEDEVVCYNLSDAKKYFSYLKRKFKRKQF
jgi:hypothetical protein